MLSVVLVNEDTTYQTARRDHTRPLMFGRPQAQASASPSLFALYAKRPPPWLFPEGFTTYPVLEAYSQTALSTPTIFAFELLAANGKWDFTEPFPLLKTNHAILHQFRGQYVAQLVGYTFDVPDLNSPEWVEWVHPKQDDESQIFPFRQIPQFVRGQQYSLYFDQPKPWRIEAEIDSIPRHPEVAQLTYAAFGRTNVFVTVPNVVGLTQAAAVSALTAVGLTASPITSGFSNTFPSGTVFTQSPVAGSILPVTSDVAITVSSGAAPQGFVQVPDITGLIIWEGLQRLEQAGVLVPASIGYFGTYPVSVRWVPSSVERGFIISQSLAPGFFVKPNSPITLTVSEFAMAVVFPAGGGTIA